MPGQPGWQRRKNRKEVKASAKPDPKELKEDLITKYGPRPKKDQRLKGVGAVVKQEMAGMRRFNRGGKV